MELQQRKSSLYGSYTVLEAVTRRQKLHNLNKGYGRARLPKKMGRKRRERRRRRRRSCSGRSHHCMGAVQF